MSPEGYTEDRLVEQPAIELFAELGWATVSALEESFGSAELSPQPSPHGRGSWLGRETKSEVVLVPKLRSALERLNPELPADAINSAIDELARDRSAMSLAAANREIWELLRDGVKVSVPDRERGGQKTERVRVIDWDNPQANDFLLVSQMTITGDLYTCRPDLIGFVNGLPFVVIELKKPGVPARQAFDENLTSYKHLQNGIPALFWYNAFMIASNGTDSRVGSLTADWERFTEWKRIEREDEPRRVSLEVMLRGLCEPARLLDFVENFTLFSEHKTGLVKAIAQNHQYLGVNNAIRATLAARAAGAWAWRGVLADAGIGQELCDGFLCAEDPAQGARQLDVRDRDRPSRAGRADRQDLCRLWRGERCQRLPCGNGRGAAGASGAATTATCLR